MSIGKGPVSESLGLSSLNVDDTEAAGKSFINL